MNMLVVVVPLLASCGAGALETHAVAADGMRNLLDVARTAIETEAADAQRAAGRLAREENRSLDDALAEARAPFVGLALTHIAAVGVWQLWVESLLHAANHDGELSMAMDYVARLLSMYSSMRRDLERVTHYQLPPVPDWMVELLEDM